jgi:hypothetical protein
MLNKLFNWLFGSDKKEETAEPAAWPFPVASDYEKAQEGLGLEPSSAPKVTRKPKARKATTTKKKAPAKAKAKTTKTKKTTTKKPSK